MDRFRKWLVSPVIWFQMRRKLQSLWWKSLLCVWLMALSSFGKYVTLCHQLSETEADGFTMHFSLEPCASVTKHRFLRRWLWEQAVSEDGFFSLKYVYFCLFCSAMVSILWHILGWMWLLLASMGPLPKWPLYLPLWEALHINSIDGTTDFPHAAQLENLCFSDAVRSLFSDNIAVDRDFSFAHSDNCMMHPTWLIAEFILPGGFTQCSSFTRFLQRDQIFYRFPLVQNKWRSIKLIKSLMIAVSH